MGSIRGFGQIVQTAWATNGFDGGVQLVVVQKMGLQDAGRSQQSAVVGWVPKGAACRWVPRDLVLAGWVGA